MKEKVIFKERQRIDSMWIYVVIALILGTNAIIYTFFIPFDEKELMFSIVFMSILLAFLTVIRLETEITSEGIYYRFFPLKKRTLISKEDIAECYFRVYKPFWEYGGWGIRFGLKGRAYNIRGNKGIQLVLKDGKKILIGTSDENEVKKALEVFWNKKRIEE